MEEDNNKNNDRLIRFDWAAKRMLRDKANFGVLEGLISVLTGQHVKIQEILESESNQECESDKFNRVDIKAKNSHGEIIIVEIQLSRQVHYLERLLFGVGKAITEHINKGENYEKVKKVYSISLIYFNIGSGDDYAYKGQTTFVGIHSGKEFELNDRERTGLNIKRPKEIFPEYYLICVNQFDKIARTPLEEWVDFLKNERIRPDTTTPGLREAAEKLRYMKMTPEEKQNYERYLERMVDEEEYIETARLEGKAIGVEEGIAKGMKEGIAKGMKEGAEKREPELVMRMASNGMQTDDIAKMTGISIERINAILKK